MARQVGSWLVGISLLVMLMAATGWGTSLDDVKEQLQQASESAKQTSESWAHWASEKFSRGLSEVEGVNFQHAADAMGDAASAVKEKASEAATGVNEKVSSAYEAAKEKVGEAYSATKPKDL